MKEKMKECFQMCIFDRERNMLQRSVCKERMKEICLKDHSLKEKVKGTCSKDVRNAKQFQRSDCERKNERETVLTRD